MEGAGKGTEEKKKSPQSVTKAAKAARSKLFGGNNDKSQQSANDNEEQPKTNSDRQHTQLDRKPDDEQRAAGPSLFKKAYTAPGRFLGFVKSWTYDPVTNFVSSYLLKPAWRLAVFVKSWTYDPITNFVSSYLFKPAWGLAGFVKSWTYDPITSFVSSYLLEPAWRLAKDNRLTNKLVDNYYLTKDPNNQIFHMYKGVKWFSSKPPAFDKGEHSWWKSAGQQLKYTILNLLAIISISLLLKSVPLLLGSIAIGLVGSIVFGVVNTIAKARAADLRAKDDKQVIDGIIAQPELGQELDDNKIAAGKADHFKRVKILRTVNTKFELAYEENIDKLFNLYEGVLPDELKEAFINHGAAKKAKDHDLTKHYQANADLCVSALRQLESTNLSNFKTVLSRELNKASNEGERIAILHGFLNLNADGIKAAKENLANQTKLTVGLDNGLHTVSNNVDKASLDLATKGKKVDINELYRLVNDRTNAVATTLHSKSHYAALAFEKYIQHPTV